MPITGKAHPLYAVRLWKHGNTTIFPIYHAVLKALNAVVGDLMLVRVHPPYITLRVARPESLMPVEQFTEADLPPQWPTAKPATDERTR